MQEVDTSIRTTHRLLYVVIRAALFGMLAANSYGATLTVTSKTDSGTGSLRSAVASASSGDTIDFDCAALGGCPAMILLSSQGNNQGFPGPTALVIAGKSITIDGGTLGNITLKAQPGATSATSLRHFFVDSDASLTLANSIVTGGAAIGGNGGTTYQSGGGGGGGLGGAIFNDGALALDNVDFVGNSAIGGHGGYSFGLPSGGGGGGGMGGDGSSCGGGGGTGGNAPVDQNCGDGGPGLSGNYGGYMGGGSGYYGGGGGSSGAGSRGGAGSSGGGGGGCAIGGGCIFGGAGGFGGGGGNGSSSPGAAGWGGGVGGFPGNGAGGRGGGGAAFGGAVFVRAGSLTVSSSGETSMKGDTVSANGGGLAEGTGLFVYSGVPVTFDVAGAFVVGDTIGAGAITKLGNGSLILDGANTYGGVTTVSAGTLAGTGDLVGPVTLEGGAVIAPGDPAVNGGVGTLSIGALTWNSGGAISFQLGSGASGGDLLMISGKLSNNGVGVGTSYKFHFGMGANPPVTNSPYTLIQCADASAFSPGNFSFDHDSSYVSLSGTFSINANTVQFTLTSLLSDRVFQNGFE